MPSYLAPGVYVEEVPSGSAPIVGVGTSTAGFLGLDIPDELTIPVSSKKVQDLKVKEVIEGSDNTEFDLPNHPIRVAAHHEVRVNGVPDTGAVIENDEAGGKSTVTLSEAPRSGDVITADYVYDYLEVKRTPSAAENEIKLCTNFGEFKKHFGDFSTSKAQQWLAQAVYGFFLNGGTRCFVMRASSSEVAAALKRFEAVDEIALVAAPGWTSDGVRSAVVSHCQQPSVQDRFAMLDSDKNVEDLSVLDPSNPNNTLPSFSDYAAFYFPWLEVLDPATKIQDPFSDGHVYVPPSGHMAGIYARVDSNRGVHKAPANESVLGALGLKYQISKGQQMGLNPQGVNCIRELNGSIRVWGARTIGGDQNGEWKYINVRRLFLFLRESIDEGTQWTVFEPNAPALWAKIRRNVSAFLNIQWREGALFGNTPQEAFFVKCDEETNPPEVRDAGRVETEIGVAVVKPAEFVIFRITQWVGPGG